MERDTAEGLGPEHVNATGSLYMLPAYIRTTSMIVCILVMVLGVVGNIMVPLVVFCGKAMRSSTNIFLVSLSVADLWVLLVCVPTVLVEVNSGLEIWALGEHMCKAVPFVESTVTHASVLTILAISFEHFYAICAPLTAGYVCTQARATCLCFLAWAAAALCASPSILLAEYQMERYVDGTLVPVCRKQSNEDWSDAFLITTIVAFFFLPLFILVILYAITVTHLMANPKINRGPANNLLKLRKQVVLMLGTVVLSFFICLLPFKALTLWVICASEESMLRLGFERYYSILYFGRLMLYFHSAVNPILYNLMSSKFREEFSRMCDFGTKKKIPGRTGIYTTGSANSCSKQLDFCPTHSSSKSCNVKVPNTPLEKQVKLSLLSPVTDDVFEKEQESYV